MIKYFIKRKKEKELQKKIQHEVLETLCTICLILYYDRPITKYNKYYEYMRLHFGVLKQLSDELREELENDRRV